jgi:tetratricopeptide (TPR) repeat protein
MASVFLSYDRDDTARARHFASVLEKAGHQVWWDLHVRGGAQFSKVIEEALKAADVVVVLWSRDAIESAWVRDEAAAGRDSGRLVPVTIDGTQAPLGFRQFQTIDLSRWRGRGSPPQLKALFADIDAIARGQAAAAMPEPLQQKRPRIGAFTVRRLLLPIVAIVAVAAAAGIYWTFANSAGAPTVAIAAADSSPNSQQMARDLLINLGNLQSVKSGSMTLVGQADPSSRPDLQFQIADTGSPASRSATLALLNGKDHGVLWSDDFAQQSGNAADLKQQLAFTAGRVLECALDGLTGDGNRLSGQTLKTYLNACAQLADSGDPRPVLPMLRQVTRDAPQFEPAWSKLLVAQAAVADLNFNGGRPDEQARSDLRQMIEEARKLNPPLAEADLAQSVLLPPRDYAKALALIDRAARQSPDDSVVLSFRSSALMGVGRMDEAVGEAARAAQLDPLSPALSAAYVMALAYAGLVEPAHKQLDEVERRWPGTASARQARYAFFFRYGDPKVALAMPETQEGTAGVPYLLEARIDPSPANVDRLVRFLRARKDKFGADAGADRLAYYTLAMGQFHQDDELFDTLMSWGKPNDLALLGAVYFRPELHDLRKEPRFMQVMKRAGLLDYWRSSGKWPDFCFYADMTYDCKVEAAKLG